ncbi:hypothetical protein GCM10027169_36480 [Gordonia jinhuaensis]|uniref:EspG family protein n=1 Tax=Gordonia jinhuaensis TaxID=1517702 RepID=A0A916T2E4_9ACTN|nr:ESX secretion-associated protein EspG [Gordonia jinhuaensis]GGB29212.1 hypothetical protein GCM10011489_16660 [Gordonia jinhuaensis]
MSAWSLSTMQFRVLWQHMMGDDLPLNFTYGTGEITTVDQAEGMELRARDELLASLSADQEAMFAALFRSTYTIEVLGFDVRDLDDPRGRIRIFSGGHPAGFATIAIQRPGPTPEVGGRIQIAQVPWSRWTTQIVRMLPPSPGPGRLPAIEGLDNNGDDQHAGADRPTFLVHEIPDPAHDAARSFYLSPTRHTTGSIVVRAGSLRDAIPAQEISLEYRDEPDDGRYVYTHFGRMSAEPVGPEQLAALILRCLRTVKQRRDDLMEAYTA